MEHVIFDGVDLSSLSRRIVALAGSRQVASVSSSTERVNGLDGYVFMGADLVPEPVEFYLMFVEGNEEERASELHKIAPILMVKEPVTLAFSRDNGLYYIGMPSDKLDFKEFVRSGKLRVTFQPLHAAMYGRERTVTIPSGGSLTFTVNGTYPTMPKIEASAAVRDASSNVWGLRLDEMDFLHVQTGSASARSVSLDCENRVCIVNSLVSLPTLDSDWLELTPDTHTIRNDQGTGACTVTWRERWL